MVNPAVDTATFTGVTETTVTTVLSHPLAAVKMSEYVPSVL